MTNDNTRQETLDIWVTSSEAEAPERVTVMSDDESIAAVKHMSGKGKIIDVLRNVFKTFEKLQEPHVALLKELASVEQNLWLPEEYEPYLKEFQGDKVAQEFVPLSLYVGFSGSRKFGQELKKIKGKQLPTQRKTYWMFQESIDELNRLKVLFGMNKSQTFDLMVKFYFRISGNKEELDRLELHKLSVDIDAVMEELSDHFGQIKKKLNKLYEQNPEHFVRADWSADHMEFGEPEDGFLGWDGVMNNFPVLLNHFEKYVHSNSKGLPECFLDPQGTVGIKEEGGSDESESF